MVTRRSLLALAAVGAALVGGGGITTLSYATAIRDAERRSSTGSQTISSSVGLLEYADLGQGPPLLMIHGTGGGFDQGLAFVRLPGPCQASFTFVLAADLVVTAGQAIPQTPQSSWKTGRPVLRFLDPVG